MDDPVKPGHDNRSEGRSGTMTIKMYGFWRSIASFRVRVALRLKGFEFEEIPVDILSGMQFEPAYDAVNAAHSLPTLLHDGQTLFQSLPIIEYLDQIRPEPALLPPDAAGRAYARALAMVTVADGHPLMVPRVRKYLGETFNASHDAEHDWVRHWVSEGFKTYERLLTERPPAPFAIGTSPGLADICIAGHVASANYVKLDTKAFPVTAALAARCFAIPAFAMSHPLAQPGAPKPA
jgi:maleylpyruvate isomerase